MHGETSCSRTGRSHGTACGRWQAVSGKSKTYADDERTWEVGQFRSTAEVSEQSRPYGGGGGGGGKGTGQGELAAAKRVPDPEPERRAQCAGAGTRGGKECAASASSPEARAGCGNSARPDPWRWSCASTIPTPTARHLVRSQRNEWRAETPALLLSVARASVPVISDAR